MISYNPPKHFRLLAVCKINVLKNVKNINPVKAGTIPQYTLSYSKLFVWNMTMYERLLWLDSDCLVVKSLDRILARANRSKDRVKCYPVF